MAYRISFREPLHRERARIALEQIDKAMAELSDDATDVHTRVHCLRRRAKKIRALARLFRPVDEEWYQGVNVGFRDLARGVSDLRDSQAAIDTFDATVRYFEDQLFVAGFLPVRQTLLQQRRRRLEQDTTGVELCGLQQRLHALKIEVKRWPEDDIDSQVLVAGFAKTYKRARRNMKLAASSADPQAWHQWRKRVKYHGHHWKLLRELWPAPINCWRGEVKGLSDLLGRDHDIVQLSKMLDVLEFTQPRTSEALLGLLQQRGIRLRSSAHRLGEKLFAEKPGHVKDRLAVCLRQRQS